MYLFLELNLYYNSALNKKKKDDRFKIDGSGEKPLLEM